MVRMLLAGALASALAFHVVALRADSVDADPIDPADATEIVETLLGIAPQRHANPLAAMQGWGALYARTRDAVLAGDETARRLWFLIAFAAQARGDAALNQSFADDLYPAYRADPQGFLDSLAEAPWLAATLCDRLAAHFGSGDRPAAGLSEFLASAEPGLAAALPEPATQACLSALKPE